MGSRRSTAISRRGLVSSSGSAFRRRVAQSSTTAVSGRIVWRSISAGRRAPCSSFAIVSPSHRIASRLTRSRSAGRPE
ncbi:MAG TPA: hypothetical protein ENK31_04555 [Nannocystis exedens]|nr:hypothetical protein [Nannocystis exedens]